MDFFHTDYANHCVCELILINNINSYTIILIVLLNNTLLFDYILKFIINILMWTNCYPMLGNVLGCAQYGQVPARKCDVTECGVWSRRSRCPIEGDSKHEEESQLWRSGSLLWYREFYLSLSRIRFWSVVRWRERSFRS